MNHTPTPWKVFYTKITHNPPILGIGDSEGVGITDSRMMMWGDPDEAKANAEYIVLCVNEREQLKSSHDELLEAAKEVMRSINNSWAGDLGTEWPEEYAILEKAIAAAERKE